MRSLLFLSHRIPFPPDKGDKIRSYHLLRHLASRYKIHLGCFFDEAADERHVPALREFCADVYCLPLSGSRKAARALRALTSGTSMSEACHQDIRMHDWVRRTLADSDVRDVFVFCSAMYPYVRDRARPLRVVVDLVDVDSEKWDAYARSAQWPLRSLYRFEQRHVLALEIEAAAACDRALFVSKAEADAFLRLAPHLSERVDHLDNGVDFARFDSLGKFFNPFRAESSAIVFTGAMNYRPNIDAVAWFANEVFPAVRRDCPRAEFWIVGAAPAASVRRLSRRPGITVTGAVADVRPYLANASCAVAPLRIARGVQNKVLEAMAMAKPVVLTSAALEGTSAVPGLEVLLADDPRDFAHAVRNVLAGGAVEVGRAARARIERDYIWSRNLRVLDRLLPPLPSTAESSCGNAREEFFRTGTLS